MSLFPDDNFPKLSKAPITEAVLELRGRAQHWDPQAVQAQLKQKLPEHTVEVLHQLQIGLLPGKPPTNQDLGCIGAIATSSDKTQICRFEKDTFAFSQLAPYPGWDEFVQRALGFWAIHQQLASPAEIAHIGLRFINRLDIKNRSEINTKLERFPQPPDLLNLPFCGFFHQHSFAAPEISGSVNLATALKTDPMTHADTLIVDIDVTSMNPWSGDVESLHARLSKMRVLKNRAFFGSLTKHTIDQLE